MLLNNILIQLFCNIIITFKYDIYDYKTFFLLLFVEYISKFLWKI